MKFLADTNVFWDILQEWSGKTPNGNLLTLLRENGVISFCLPEICALEIYSVLGKNARGKNNEENRCTRSIKTITGEVSCLHTWVSTGTRKLPNREVLALQRTIKEILNNQVPDFSITIIPLDRDIIEKGTNLLHLYSAKYDFHSLDAIVAASAADTMTIITYDRKLKNVLKEASISHLP
ncbi:MAG: hypothetical protein WCR52_10505 [Bacteroidota bacterium]